MIEKHESALSNKHVIKIFGTAKFFCTSIARGYDGL